MKSWTVSEMVNERSCYGKDRIVELWAGKPALTLREILALDIPLDDRLWVAWRPSALTDAQYEAVKIRVVTRAVTNHALTCGIPAVERWAAKWLDGSDRTDTSAARAAWAAEAAELDLQIKDVLAVLDETEAGSRAS